MTWAWWYLWSVAGPTHGPATDLTLVAGEAFAPGLSAGGVFAPGLSAGGATPGQP